MNRRGFFFAAGAGLGATAISLPPSVRTRATGNVLPARYDHRLRELVRDTGNVTIATDLGVPRSTARGWLRKAPAVVVSLDVTNLTTSPAHLCGPTQRELARETAECPWT